MSYNEKSIFVSLFQATIVFGLYSNYMFGMYQDGRFDGADRTWTIRFLRERKW